jgi:hypothetical protein
LNSKSATAVYYSNDANLNFAPFASQTTVILGVKKLVIYFSLMCLRERGKEREEKLLRAGEVAQELLRPAKKLVLRA